ncbi:MAG: DUF1573 domain-containing protein [Planctomycetota bacterium]|nr:MAG: DUF1573 domain-containing protein [Planctomycetota bacterium]
MNSLLATGVYGPMLRRAILGLMFAVCLSLPTFGQEWARKMFSNFEHDFGVVARGAKAEYRFVFKNLYVEDVHVLNARSSCGCTIVSVENPTVKTYEEGAIVARVNSTAFLGARGATITVTFDKPYYAEVQLHVRSYIRSDVVFSPESVQFGTVEQGEEADREVTVTYAGRSDWKIVDVKTPANMTAEVEEVSRSYNQVVYKLKVHLDKSAPAGYLNDHIVLVTNDYRYEEVPVTVEGMVQSPITVSPGNLFLGVVKPGQTVTKTLVIRGKEPFRILSISCEGAGFEFDLSKEKDAEPKTVHVVPVTFKAGEEPGKIAGNIKIETDLGIEPPAPTAMAVINPNIP